MRVPQFLSDNDVPFETMVHAPAFTAQKRAKVLHLPGRQIAKTVLLGGPTGHFLAVLPATHQVDTDALSAAFGGPVRLATGREVTEIFRDCEWGVVEPFGSLYGLPTVIDESFDANAFIVFEGHTHAQTIRMRCRHFERLERPRRLRFAERTP